MLYLINKVKMNYSIDKIILVILVLISLILNVNQIKFVYGITFSVSSLIILFIFRVWGYKVSLISSIIVYVLSVLVWKASYLDIFLIAEVCSLNLLTKYKPKWNMIILDIIFWIIIALPIKMLIYQYLGQSIGSEYIWFLIAKDLMNGILNFIVADIIVSYIPIRKWILNEEDNNYLIHFKDLIFHVLIISVMTPLIFNLFINSLNSYENMIEKTKQLATSIAGNIENGIQSWSDEEINRLLLGDVIKIGYLTEIVNNEESINHCHISIKSIDDKTIVSNNLVESSLDKYGDCKEDTEYIESNYLIEDFRLNINVKIPINDYKERVYDDNMSQFRLITFFSIFIAGGVIFINKYLFKGIGELAITTSSFVEQLDKISSIKWPSSNVFEISSLTENFKCMANDLKKKFIESKTLNSTLEIQAIELIKSKEELHKQAYYDMLTSLPNRLNFKEYLQLVKEDNIDGKVAVIFMDMNHFKQINDSLGHDAGDKLLVLIAERLSKIVSDEIKVFRLGGDEFVVVASKVNDTDIDNIGNRILDILKDNFIIEKREFPVTVSLGVSVYPDDSKDIISIIKYADIAMYRCKENGGSYLQKFNDKIKKDFLMKYTIEKEITLALRNKEIELYYQPKIDVKSNTVSSLEALLRWNSSKMGYVPPDVFIPIVEESDLILIIDKFVLIEACKTIKEIHDRGHKNVSMTINISAGHFTHGNLINEVHEALNKYKVNSKFLKIEITESILIKNIDKAIGTINGLRKIGVGVSIDDFGRGFSSFSQLINLPIDELKIDRDFITNVDKNDKKGMVVKLIIELAHGLKLNTVAEGIERKEECDFLKEAGCDELQGYFYSKAVEKEKIIRFLEDFQ